MSFGGLNLIETTPCLLYRHALGVAGCLGEHGDETDDRTYPLHVRAIEEDADADQAMAKVPASRSQD
jgi:hypothetical protein